MFPPVERDGHRLVDGLALVPVPTDAVAEAGADVTVSVNLMSRETLPRLARPEPPPPPDAERRGSRMLETLLEVMDLVTARHERPQRRAGGRRRHAALRARPAGATSSWRTFPGGRPRGGRGAASRPAGAGTAAGSTSPPKEETMAETFTFDDLKTDPGRPGRLDRGRRRRRPERDVRVDGPRLARVRGDPARHAAGVRLHDPRRGRGADHDGRARRSTTSTGGSRKEE